MAFLCCAGLIVFNAGVKSKKKKKTKKKAAPAPAPAEEPVVDIVLPPLVPIMSSYAAASAFQYKPLVAQ